MVDPVAARRLAYRVLFAGIAALVLFVRMLPLGAVPSRVPGPDFILCGTIAWVLRRPDYAPAALIAAVLLMEDILAMRPPGLWPLVVLLGTGYLRSREASFRDLPFALEWLVAGALVIAVTVINGLVLAIFLVPQAPAGLTALRTVVTILAYPGVVLIAHFVFGLRRAAPGQVDAFGRRI